ncbi:bifunctional GNAT family N-acetyltransferase/carbon-nitrogen hydrolase family protein [Emcibacter nanhaiensis]|uniref:GNAT family N-acetyltransferase n=1 Tax=Emcibacter nanhaiensis TaxID=1505037 RepID=A0A501PPR4_9PROT|nr:bifunctional GNAT family N-acetyltransferase/carbon-nitrogen hydrolase family protein [Emcibacter nanhaiensis]TPD61954.1 GNAT family N-acetyltransferase [Emcibacter nanhaiensis]
MSNIIRRQKLFIRTATQEDVPGMTALNRKVYGEFSFTEKMIASHIKKFPEGQIIAIYEGRIVGHAATFIIDEKTALRPHTWKQITGKGFATHHDPEGDFLYGMEVCVDPDMRRLRIGQRLYNMRKKLCVQLGLKGIVFGGRMPGYARYARKGMTPEDYLAQVQDKKIRDMVIGFQLRNEFEPVGILRNYLVGDKESADYAVHMVWRNALYVENTPKQQRRHRPGVVRVASVQFEVRKVKSFEDFMNQIEYFVDIASDYRADFVVFPELYTQALLSAEDNRLTPQESTLRLTSYTDDYVKAMNQMAISYNINIIGGTHPTLEGEDLKNISYIFLRGGEVHKQAKLHATPNEEYWWNMKGGDELNMIQTDCGPIGVLICYDSEFPELARHLADQGAMILFVPFCTDERQGYLRVRYCSQARAVENQLYVVTSGVVGNLPDVENMDIHYASSHIFTPCDFPFARDGIAAEAESNAETIIFADLNMDDLLIARKSGTVRNFKDRRFDLYEVNWLK